MAPKKTNHDTASRQIRWLSFSNSHYAICILFLLCFALSAAFVSSKFNDDVEDAIGRPSLFSLRTSLHLTPPLDPHIKVLAYDDDTVAALGRPELLGPEPWLQLVNAVEKRRPKIIMFDRVYANKPTSNTDLEQTKSIFQRALPVASGVFLSNQELSGWNSLHLNSEFADAAAPFVKEYAHEFIGLKAYGPHPEFAVSARYLGHLNYRSPGWFFPLIAFAPNLTIRHLSLFAAKQVQFQGAHLLINGRPVYLTDRGEALLNWSKKEDYFKASYSISALLNKARANQELTSISADDTVIILPKMHTGNTDFKGTMIGYIPGGYSQVTAVNMVLQDAWLYVVETGYTGILLACLFGIATAYWQRTASMFLFIFGMNILYIASVAALFCYAQVVVTWVAPLCALNLLSILVLLMRTTSREILALRVDDALRGVVSPKILERIKSNPLDFRVLPEEKVLTVIFVDFVGFSASAESVIPQVLFEFLKVELNMMSSLIHTYGGIVDKTLGDGLMGFFGYDPLTRETSEHHADQALNCAAAIQIELAKRCIKPASPDAPFFPARIGINTGPTYVGNLGDEGKIDLTLIGHSVNLAKRLEDAAQPFKVLVGPTTRTSLKDTRLQAQMALRMAPIKHESHLVNAFEFDPFENEIELYQKAMEAFRRRSDSSRNEERYLIDQNQIWEIWSQGKRIGKCVDYSVSGCCLDLDIFLANKVMLNFDFKVFEMSVLGDKFELYVARNITAKVCWGKISGQMYRHGMQFTDESIKRMQSDVNRMEDVAK